MSTNNPDLIILAAGHSLGADGVIKCLIKHPKTKKNILETAKYYFPNFKVRVVIGYRALEIVSAHPELSYVVNDEWSFTGNSHSLALALRNRKTLVVSGDLFVSQEMVKILNEKPNRSIAFTARSERRRGNAINFRVDEQERILSHYTGKMETVTDPESLGAFWIGDADIAKQWKRRCEESPNKFAAECLPLDCGYIYSRETPSDTLYEITDAKDFLSFSKRQTS